MKRAFSICACALGISLVVPGAALPSVTGWGNIYQVFGTQNGAVLFNTTGARTTPLPACGVNNPTRFAINASTPAGQAAVSLLITAKQNGKQIAVWGSGACDIWGDTETISWIQIQD